MFVSNAKADKQYRWQNALQVLRIKWLNHFYNTYQNNRLKPIRGDGRLHLPCPYDQCYGELNIYDTKNVHGAIWFGYHVAESQQNIVSIHTDELF